MDAVTDPVVTDPGAAAAAAAATTNPPAATPAPEPPAPAPAPTDPDGRTKGSPPQWMLDRIARETRKREETERAAADRIATLQAELAAARAGQNPPAAAAPPPSQPAQPELRAAIDQAADAKLLNQARGDIVRAGHQAFGAQKFDQECAILAAVDCVNDAFISDVLAVDRTNAHKLLSTLAAQPETAARLSQLDSRSRIAELTRMSMAAPAAATTPAPGVPPAAPAAPAAPARAVSRAPAPPPPVEPSVSKEKDWRADDSTEEEFNRGFIENQERRFKQRMGR